jgi:alpha-beta hydrolase superfamily lysophospholipase
MSTLPHWDIPTVSVAFLIASAVFMAALPPSSTASAADAVNDSSRDGLLGSLINLPRSPDFAVSDRGERLHVRSSWPLAPQGSSPRGVVLSLHGYAAHSSRPTHAFMARVLNAEGFVYTTLDFHGHGYSEGERGFVQGADALVNDVLSVLLALYSPTGTPAGSSGFSIERSVAGLPLFVMGHSMGGGTALLIANILAHGAAATAATAFFHRHQTALEQLVMPNFRGAMLMCPVVDMAVSPTLRALLISPLAWALPSAAFPRTFFDENSQNHLVWASKRYRDYIHSDGFPRNPQGLSWGSNIRFGTLASIMELSDRVIESLPQATFPFVVLHDKEHDIAVPFASTEKLVARAPSTSKLLKVVEGGLHDLLGNRADVVAEEFIEWLRKHT